MDNRNKTCPECGKKFHACPSCGLIHDYEYNYCSLECYKKSLTYDEYKRKIISLMLSAKTNIMKLDELTYFLQEDIADDIYIFLDDPEIQEVWYKE